MTFSSRSDWERTPNAIARLRTRLDGEGIEILDLTESNPTRCQFDYPIELVAPVDDPRLLSYEPAARGMQCAREAIAEGRAGSIDPEHLLLTCSTSEAYAWLFKLLCESGDQVLVPTPSYPLLDYIARLESVQLVPYRLVFEDRWNVDLDDLERRITPRTRAVIVVHPNNPTGSYLSRAEGESLRNLCAANRLPIISDEVFFDYPLDDPDRRPPSFLSRIGPLTFVLGGLSKQVGLPQMKLSWIAVHGPKDERDEAIERLELIGDTFLSVSTFVQTAAGALVSTGRRVHSQILDRIRENRTRLLAERSEQAAWDSLPIEGGWSAVVRLPRILPDEEWAMELLRHDQVLVQPGYFYDFPEDGSLVLSLLPPPAIFSEGVRRIASRVAAIS